MDMLQDAKDFPKDGSILIITDGEIEKYLDIKKEHTYIYFAIDDCHLWREDSCLICKILVYAKAYTR